MNERRMHIRYDFQREIEYKLQENLPQTFKGITVNISDSGLGLYVFDHLNSGDEITIKSDIRELNRRCQIRWCNELGENIYKVGAMFVS